MEMDASIDVTFPFERIYSRLFVPSGKDHVLVFLFGNLIFLGSVKGCYAFTGFVRGPKHWHSFRCGKFECSDCDTPWSGGVCYQ